MGTKESLHPLETGTPSKSVFEGGRYLGVTPYPVGSMSPGVGVPGMTPDGRTLAVRPPVFPSVGTFFSRVRARPVLPRPPMLTHPVPTLAPRSFVSRSGVLPVVCSSGPCLRVWVVLFLGVRRVPPGGVLSGVGVVGVRGVLCLRVDLPSAWGVGLLRLRLL